MNHRLAVPHHGHTFLHKSVEQFSMDVSVYRNIVNKYFSNKTISSKDISGKPEFY